MKSELHNLWQGDLLFCSACYALIYNLPLTGQVVYFRNIDKAYYKHVKECMPLRRLIVTLRNGKAKN
jgi:hypothetical protein